MATVDTYLPFNMLGEYSFSNLFYAEYYYGDSGWFTAGYSDGTNDTFWGYGFTYDSYYGAPTGEGTVTGYSLFTNWSEYLVVNISDINISVSSVLSVALTSSTADDFNLVKAALAGADTILGSDYADVLDGFNGNDTLRGYAGNDFLYGEAGNDRIFGMTGNDKLNGGAGTDHMGGGAGNDIYVVDITSDIVDEGISGSNGSDTVQSSISYSLINSGRVLGSVENLTLLGTGKINGTGNALNNVITGNSGTNTLIGGAGNDTINGGGGNDYLYGGAGNDKLNGGAGYDNFIFNTKISAASNIDTITDFNVAHDTIRLDNAVMSALGNAFESGEFWKSTSGTAHDKNDRIIYETDTGWLNYDSNGSASGGSVHIAKLAPNLALSYADFLVI